MSETVPQAFWQGVEQFNQGEFYACHDTLEALWMEASEPLKTFYQGILQIAVALYHLGNHNWRGAAILLGEGMNRLRYYQPTYADIDVERLILQSTELLNALQSAGSENMADLVAQLTPASTSPMTESKDNPSLQLPQIVALS